jgi:hypothetical protein
LVKANYNWPDSQYQQLLSLDQVGL